MTPTLLLSGAGLPDWIWDEVRDLLPGESRVAPRPGGDAPLPAYVDAALAAVEDWETFSVVAHSAGGVVGCGLVAEAAGRVDSFVAVSASIPEPGQSFLGALPFPQRALVGAVIRLLGTRPPAREIRVGLAKGATDEQAERIVADFAPESRRLYRDPTPAREFPAASAYVLTTADTQFSPTLQEAYAARLGGRVERLDTAHLPMLEDPAALAAILQRVAQPS